MAGGGGGGALEGGSRRGYGGGGLGGAWGGGLREGRLGRGGGSGGRLGGGVQVGRVGVLGGGGAQAPLTSPCPPSNHTITINLTLTFAASWFGHASHDRRRIAPVKRFQEDSKRFPKLSRESLVQTIFDGADADANAPTGPGQTRRQRPARELSLVRNQPRATRRSVRSAPGESRSQ